MSDFLSQLIEKNLTIPVAIRPRLASRFEPQIGRDLLPASAIDSEAAEGEHTFGEIFEEVVSQIPFGPPVTRPPGPVVTESQPVPVAGPNRFKAEPHHISTKQQQLPKPESALRPPITERQASPTNQTQVPIAAQNKPQLRPETPAEEQRPFVLEPVVREHVFELKSPSTEPVPGVVSQPEPPRNHTSGTGSHEPAISRAKEAPHIQSAPTIQVTIGRIEVRAETSPPPKPRLTPIRRSPALSLDDYLKQRNGGR